MCVWVCKCVWVCAMRHMCVVTICCVCLSFVPFIHTQSRAYQIDSNNYTIRYTHNTRKQTCTHPREIHLVFVCCCCCCCFFHFIRFYTQHITLNSFQMNRWARETKQFRSETVSCAHIARSQRRKSQNNLKLREVQNTTKTKQNKTEEKNAQSEHCAERFVSSFAFLICLKTIRFFFSCQFLTILRFTRRKKEFENCCYSVEFSIIITIKINSPEHKSIPINPHLSSSLCVSSFFLSCDFFFDSIVERKRVCEWQMTKTKGKILKN